MRFLITADWQAKPSTLDACERAHEQELRIIRTKDIDGHFDLGDLKDAFNPVDVDVIQFQQKRKNNIHEAVKYDVTILGNHDKHGQNDSNRDWFSIFDSDSGHNLTSPQVLTLGDITVSCLPYCRDLELLRKQAKELWNEAKLSSKKRILLFHANVQGAKLNQFNIRSEAKLSLKDLHTANYDRCFGGDIHLRQKLSSNTMYVGNPFATDSGEIDQAKGFIIYDTDKDKIFFIPSAVPGLFSWNYVKVNKPKLIDGTKIKAIVDCEMHSDYNKQLSKTSSLIESRYPGCIPYVVPRFQIAKTKESVEINPDARDIDKIKSYVYATVSDTLRKRKNVLVSYLTNVLGNASSSGLRQSGKLIFEEIYAKNTLSLGETRFSFRNRGILLVQGKNKDSIFSSNGAGKTNFLSLAPIAIFSKTFKGQTNDQWANDKNTDKAIVHLTVSDDTKRKIEIHRQRRSTKLKLLINGNDKSLGRSHKGKNETQGRIEEVLGYTFDTFAHSVYIDQSLTNAFLSGTEKTRAELIHKFQNMDRFGLAAKLIQKDIAKVMAAQLEAEANHNNALSIIDELKIQIAKASQRNKSNLSEVREDVKIAKENLKSLRSAKRQMMAVVGAETKRLEKQVLELSAKRDKAQREADTLDQLCNIAEAKRNKFDKEKDSVDCPLCYQNLTIAHKKKVLAKLNTEFNELLARRKQKEAIVETFKNKIVAINKPLEKRKTEINALDTKINEAEDHLEWHADKLEKEKKRFSSYQLDIKEMKMRNTKQFHISIAAQKVLRNLREEMKFLDYAKAAMGRDGLPLFLNKLLCPLLNQAAEKYSDIFIDKEIQVIFSIEDGHITPSVLNARGAKAINGQSTGEKAWAAIITSFALREIAHPTNLLILDEPGYGLDEASARMFGERLHKLTPMIETIMVVSHNQAIIAALDKNNSVTITKKNKISVLK
jgi:DNA repair exonuclease SbcCD ATPase subunit